MSLLSIALMLLTSCSKDEVIPAAGNEAVVTFTANLQGQLGTKAISDGMTVDQLVFGVFQNGQEIAALRQDDVVVSGGKATVTTNLIKGETYTFVFWAQKKGTGYYTTKDLTAIVVNYNESKKTANDESRDAFYAVKTIDVKGAISETIYLKRPFAQINYGTTKADWNAVTTAGANYTQSKLEVSGVANVFNALESTASVAVEEGEESLTVTFDLAGFPAQDLTVKDVDYQYLSMNYVLVPTVVSESASEMKGVVNATMTVDGHQQPIKLDNIPVQSNYRTNIIGNLLGATADFDIIVDEEYDGEQEYDALSLVMQIGGTYTLTENLEVAEGFVVTNDVILNLNGKELKYTGNDLLFRVENGGKLIINGKEDGSAIVTYPATSNSSGRNGYVAQVWDGSTVTFNGGVYEAQGTCTIAHATEGTIYVKDGKFSVNEDYTGNGSTPYGAKYMFNCSDGNHDNGSAKIIISGGTFVNFNPANNAAEGEGTNFVAEGYESVQSGDYYTVVQVSTTKVVKYDNTKTPVENGAVLRSAFESAKDGETIAITDGEYSISSQLDIKDGKSISVIGLGDNVKIIATGNNQKAIYITGNDGPQKDMNVNIKNITIEETAVQKSTIWIREHVNVYMENVKCTSAIVDNNYNNGDVVNLDLNNCDISKLTLDASPFNNNGLNTYVNFTYDANSNVKMRLQNAINDEGMANIKINGIVPESRGWYLPVNNDSDLTATLDFYNTGEDNNYTILVADGEYTGPFTLQKFENKSLVIKSVNKGKVNFSAQSGNIFYVDGNSLLSAGILNITGLNFTMGTEVSAIRFGSGNADRYARNITIENCSFNGAGYCVHSNSNSSANDITIKDCTAEDVNTFVTAYIENLSVKDCTVKGEKGLNNQIASEKGGITVDGSTFELTGYGIRINGGIVDIKNSSIATTTTEEDEACIVFRSNALGANLSNTSLNGRGFYTVNALSKTKVTGAPANATYYGNWSN